MKTEFKIRVKLEHKNIYIDCCTVDCDDYNDELFLTIEVRDKLMNRTIDYNSWNFSNFYGYKHNNSFFCRFLLNEYSFLCKDFLKDKLKKYKIKYTN